METCPDESPREKPGSRPLAVSIIGWLFVGVGAIGLVHGAMALRLAGPMESDAVWVASVNALAVFAGIFLRRGRNWARWLSVGWMAGHVGLSVFHSWPQLLFHAMLLGIMSICLFSRRGSAHFRPRSQRDNFTV